MRIFSSLEKRNSEFKESEHPRNEDGEFATSSSSSHKELAKKSYEDRTVPDGWFVHGRSARGKGKDTLDTGYVIQTTRDWDVADQYAGEKGSKWMIKPKEDAIKLDLSSENTEDMDKIVKVALEDFRSGDDSFSAILSDIDTGQYDITEELIEEKIREAFSPSDIVDSAEAYDNEGWLDWLKEKINPDFIEVNGGAVAINIDKTHAVKVESDEMNNGLAKGMTVEDIARKHGVTVESIKAQLEKGIKVEADHAGDTTPEEIALDHLVEDAEYYTKLEVMEKTNAKQFPKAYYARHMQAGICGYKTEKILIESDQMKEMAPSFVGKPVFINHQKVDLGSIKEKAAGYISDSFYNELDGWLWVKFVVVDDAAHDAIMRGWSVSNAYIPSISDDKGGSWHNIPFNRRIMAAEFTHLAIVDSPRYEGACILSPDEFKSYQAEKKQKLNELTNKKEPSIMFSFFKTKREPVTADKIDAETMVEIDGAVISVQEMVNSVTAAKENKNASEDDDAKKLADEEKMNSEIEVGDEKMTLKDLVTAYNSMKNAKQNSDDKDADDKKKAEEAKAAEEKTNSKAADEAKAKEITNKAEGRKIYDELKNAHLKAAVSPIIETSQDKTARGQSRYGSN